MRWEFYTGLHHHRRIEPQADLGAEISIEDPSNDVHLT